MGGKKEKRGRIEENRVDVRMDVNHHGIDAGDGVENGVDKVDRDKNKSKGKREVHGDGSEFVAENVKGSVGDENEGCGNEKKKKKRKREVGQDEMEPEKAVEKRSRLSKGTESSGAKSIAKVLQIGEDGDGHTHDGDFENMEERLQIRTKQEKNKKQKEVKKMDGIDVAFSANKHFADNKPDVEVQKQNKSLGKNFDEIKDTDEQSIKKKKKKKWSRDSDPVRDHQKMEEASRSSDGVIMKMDIHEKERSKRKKHKQIEEQGYKASGNLDKKYMESEVDARFMNDAVGSEEKKLIKDRKHRNIEEIKDTDEVSIKKKKKKKGSRDSDPVGDNQRMEEVSGSSDGVIVKKDIDEKERSKRKKQKRIDERCYKASGNLDKEYMETEVDARFMNDTMGSEEKTLPKDRKSKKEKAAKDGIEGKDRKKNPKRVSFAENVEVFPPFDGPSEEDNSTDRNLVRGKKFSKEEDELVKQAVFKYIEAHDLGEDGLKMVLNCGSHREARNCWKEIGAYLPWRPNESVYHRAHLLFERSENRTWTPEECELVRKFHEQHGSDWRKLADALGRHRFHVKDTWRRIRLPFKKGPWSQDEYQRLYDLVNMDLRMKATEERKSKHGMLLDNIAWGAISDQLRSRNHAACCEKWYKQLTSSMVAEGIWADTDDYRLINALVDLDACSMEDVDWDRLIENKSGYLCRKRWNQMVKYIGDHQIKSFPEQVEILSNRYCPDMLEARETYANKPKIS